MRACLRSLLRAGRCASLGKNSVAAVFQQIWGRPVQRRQRRRAAEHRRRARHVLEGSVAADSLLFNSGRVKRGRRAFNRVIRGDPGEGKNRGGIFSSDARSIFSMQTYVEELKERESVCVRATQPESARGKCMAMCLQVLESNSSLLCAMTRMLWESRMQKTCVC